MVANLSKVSPQTLFIDLFLEAALVGALDPGVEIAGLQVVHELAVVHPLLFVLVALLVVLLDLLCLPLVELL